jgi:ferric-dicitrate binding protein FerR (iron transport regulator)
VQAPTKARATLKLDDNRIVYLDSVGNGQLAVQGNVSVVKTADGKISYQLPVASSQLEVKYNTISNPRGSKVQTLTLIDGTQVWLNAESSITYPTAFVGDERKVTITGEADFVVKHNEKMPFKVIANGVEINDVGTEFNVNAYSDEDAIRVTLLEGSVRVSKSNQSGVSSQESVVIKPGEQAVSVSSGQLAVNNNVDVEQVMAWKNGLFKFDGMTIEPLMRQIEKWYDVDVEYRGKVNSHFIATIPRTVSAMDAFRILEQTGGVHFTIEGKKVIVEQ